METSLRFGRCKVVPNGIDPKVFAERPPPGYFRKRFPELKDKLVYLFLGRLDAGKGLDLLLPAFQLLAQKQRGVHLVLAGGNERGYEAEVREMIRKLDLAQHVTLTGLITGPEKLGALQDADVYVLPSRSEGLSIAMLEAMYMGLPVIVTDRVGLWREIAEKDCGYVVSLEESELAGALLKMANNSNRASMGRNGKALVAEKYTWDVIAQNLMEEVQAAV
jgi:glycosyltransferase involved in cell wall biosynthesis